MSPKNRSMRKIAVVPNHLPHLDFLKEWDELKDTEIIVVQDIGLKPDIPDGYNVTIYDHGDIEADLGEHAWIIPTQSSACRSYGYYKAWQRQPDCILTLDTDCYPDGSRLDDHVANLERKVTLDWVNTADAIYMRGFPYGIRERSRVMLSHGLWSNVPDLDGATWLHNPDLRLSPSIDTAVIPRFNFFPMCGMNLAWNTDLTPAMYFGLFGPDYGFDQYDDIWAGVLVKKVLDHLGYAVISGYPSVEHRKQSNVFINLRKQAPGLAMNEHFWQVVRDIELTATTILDSYRELITKLPDVVQDEPEGWTAKFKKAALIWADLFQKP
jgi:hypothetical protein